MTTFVKNDRDEAFSGDIVFVGDVYAEGDLHVEGGRLIVPKNDAVTLATGTVTHKIPVYTTFSGTPVLLGYLAVYAGS